MNAHINNPESPMKRLILLFTLFATSITATLAQSFRVSSPDRLTQVNILIERKVQSRSLFVKPSRKSIDIVHNRESIIRNKELGLVVKSHGHRYSLAKSDIEAFEEPLMRTGDPAIEGDCIPELQGQYNGITLDTDIGVKLEVRIYDNGVAYRYTVSGYDEYKLLNISDIFPGEKPIAILGTLTGTYVMPWNVMAIKDKEGTVLPKTNNNPHQFWRSRNTYNPLTSSFIAHASGRPKVSGIVPWKDALTTVSVGGSINWFSHGCWKDVNQTENIIADVTYKYIYGALTFAPCGQLTYIYWDEDYNPFYGVMGSIHSWNAGARVGFSLPVQSGYNIWNFTPYITASLMHLGQHGDPRPRHNDVSPHHHYLVGPGIKVQCAMHERLSMGISYEYQFFTGGTTPRGMHSLGFTLGWLL